MPEDVFAVVADRRKLSGAAQKFSPEVEREHAARFSAGLVVEEPVRGRVRLHRRNHQHAHRDPVKSANAGYYLKQFI